jgi:HPt (histidine-containing phosphotransfer) domain-containing protein
MRMSTADPASSSNDFDGLFDDIDWSELQTFFFQHLVVQLRDLDSSLRAGDMTTISRTGHSIKGSGGGVQLPRFTELGKALEDAGKAGDSPACRAACQAIRDEYLSHRPEGDSQVGDLFASDSGEERKAA